MFHAKLWKKRVKIVEISQKEENFISFFRLKQSADMLDFAGWQSLLIAGDHRHDVICIKWNLSLKLSSWRSK
ncbi:hypothetical protein T07_14427 [Trichinella nelsoni]|uniref:Uncharacterized protein n=1 Tax=Trichinella nelsoni TaxID=6336 RepID=A0A0V0S8B1_9BILA|nr:hypothetical protein T07_14427 [Trichinella nelsoni]